MALDLRDPVFRQQQIAEQARRVVAVDFARSVFERLESTQRAGELLELVGAGAAFEFGVIRCHFLQADDVGVQAPQDVDDGVDADASILATAPMNIPTDYAHEHLLKTTHEVCHYLTVGGHTIRTAPVRRQACRSGPAASADAH